MRSSNLGLLMKSGETNPKRMGATPLALAIFSNAEMRNSAPPISRIAVASAAYSLRWEIPLLVNMVAIKATITTIKLSMAYLHINIPSPMTRHPITKLSKAIIPCSSSCSFFFFFFSLCVSSFSGKCVLKFIFRLSGNHFLANIGQGCIFNGIENHSILLA